MGGEKLLKVFSARFTSGSPPHGRGKVYLGPQLGAGYGITPAWAGKRRVALCLAFNDKDHPRVGGEKSRSSQISVNNLGSPPRRRGKESNETFARMCTRITPA